MHVAYADYQRHLPGETVHFRAVAEHWATFQARVEEAGGTIPKYVTREIEAFLACGDVCKGFSRLWCSHCKKTRVLAFSCKSRGACPSCAGRIMADTAAHLVDRVMRPQPIRQWVLTLPYALRAWAAKDERVIAAVNTTLIRTVFNWLRARGREIGVTGEPGAVSFVQRFGDGIRCTPHVHALLSDGLWVRTKKGARFVATPAPTQADVQSLVSTIAFKAEIALQRIDRHRRAEDGVVDRCIDTAMQTSLPLDDEHRPKRVRGEKRKRVLPNLCAESEGFNLHASTTVKAGAREQLERLCRYVARPPIPEDRLTMLDDGRIEMTLKRVWSDGTTTVTMDGLDYVERVVALIPPPMANLVRYSGVWAPNSHMRKHVIPQVPEPPVTRLHGGTDPPPNKSAKPRRTGWSELLARIFGVDALKCTACGKRCHVIAVVQDPTAIEMILASIHISSQPPPRARARAPPEDVERSEGAIEEGLPPWWGEGEAA